MKLIVDSGSTKTDWIALDDNGNKLFETQTLGLNPQVLTEYILEERIINNYDLYQARKEVSKIYFYGAGCGVDTPQRRIKKVFDEIFVNSDIIIKEDTYAAVYAAAKTNEKSIVCILGTGSNCSYYDGKLIDQKIISLGYSVMDDASGNYYGRQLLRDYYFDHMPHDLKLVFKTRYNVNDDVIKSNLYKKPNPNAYLATFAEFMILNKESDYIQKVIKDGLRVSCFKIKFINLKIQMNFHYIL